MTDSETFAHLRHITEQLNSCDTLDEMAVLATEIMGNPTVIFDADMRAVACPELRAGSRHFEFIREFRVIDPGTAELPEAQRALAGLWEAKGPHTYELQGERHLSRVLRVGDTPVGCMDVAALFRPLREEDSLTLELLNYPVALKLLSIQGRDSQQSSETEYCLLQLLRGKAVNSEMLRSCQEQLSLKDGEFFYLLCANSFDFGRQSREKRFAPLMKRGDVLLQLDTSTVLLMRGRKELPGPDWFDPIEEKLIAQGFRCGISYPFRSLEDLNKCYQQARAALDIGLRINGGRYLYIYEQYVTYDLFYHYSDPSDLLRFLSPGMQELIRVDQTQHLELLKTLRCYLYHNHSVQKTAELLHVHRNTVSYRVGKCFELLGHSMSDGHYLIRLCTAIQILEYIDFAAYFGEQ